MYGVVYYAAIVERKHELRLGMAVCPCDQSVCRVFASHPSGRPRSLPSPGAGLLNTYKSLFSLDDSLAEIQTRDSLFDYLREVSKQARLIQPLSSEYFVEDISQLKVISGVCTASTHSVFLALNSPEMWSTTCKSVSPLETWPVSECPSHVPQIYKRPFTLQRRCQSSMWSYKGAH